MTKIVAVFNIKGGVGKTTSSVNLAAMAASRGFKTLLWDMDPQGATSFYLRVKNKIKGGVSGLTSGKHPVTRQIKASDYRDLHVLPADISYRLMDEQIRKAGQKSSRYIREILKPVLDDYDMVIVDCPPQLSETIAGLLRVVDLLLVPSIPTILSLRTVKQMQGFIKKDLNSPVKMRVFFSQVDMRKAMHRNIVEKFLLKNNRVSLQTIIPSSSDVEKMGIELAPFIHFEPDHKVTNLYGQLWDEIQEILMLEIRPGLKLR
ncbi:MAG: cobyrinic acid a,c-diamide synthase [Gammaproteobacteria bacterium]|nr:MAG: cobyrinic acid a,c-diamide synthase [Pseudomonadota bacterium]PIE38502.1 MAG: cobyrinic acid a,c-diamide synthase [Gammaproteobacteria bacterium]